MACVNRVHDADAAGGPDLTMIGKLLGQTQVQTTARYAHLAWEAIQIAASYINETIGGDLIPPKNLEGLATRRQA